MICLASGLVDELMMMLCDSPTRPTSTERDPRRRERVNTFLSGLRTCTSTRGLPRIFRHLKAGQYDEKIAWLASFGIAVTMAVGMRSENCDWVTTLISAAVTCIVLPDVLLSVTVRRNRGSF